MAGRAIFAPQRRDGLMRSRGFSLIELLLVIVLIAAIAAVGALAMGRALPGQQLRNSAKEVAAQLRYARAQAIATGQAQVFSLDARSRQWSGPNRRHGELPQGIEVRATTARIEQRSPDAASIRFFPQGASTGGRIVLSRDSAAWQVDVDWLTGQVRLHRAEAVR
jgi:general secretion pathway protein H